MVHPPCFEAIKRYHMILLIALASSSHEGAHPGCNEERTRLYVPKENKTNNT